MTTVNANVTAGHSFTPPVLVTADDLNELGVPAVSVDLAAKVALADLAAATANYLVTGTATVGAEGAGAADAVDVTVQLTNSSGTNMAVVCPVHFWISTAALGAPTAFPSGATTHAVVGSDGTILQPYAANVVGAALTSAAGKLVIRFTEAAAPAGVGSRYFQCWSGVKVIQGSAALTWA